MKQKFLSVIMAITMAGSIIMGCGSNASQSDSSAAAVTMVDVGAEYEVSTEYDEYTVLPHYFAETDQNVDMVVTRDSNGTKYSVQFTFFGDAQQLDFTVSDGTPSATYDKTGFIEKDLENLWAEIKEYSDWTSIR